jgi:predicted nucleotidyltransferase
VTITQEKLAQYRTTAHKRAQAAEAQVAARLARAQAVAKHAATWLRQHYPIERVVVFGSLVQPSLFHERSDIDLAVWGLDERHYYRVVGELQALDAEFSIDLIRMEEAPLSLQTVIETEGEPL